MELWRVPNPLPSVTMSSSCVKFLNIFLKSLKPDKESFFWKSYPKNNICHFCKYLLVDPVQLSGERMCHSCLEEKRNLGHLTCTCCQIDLTCTEKIDNSATNDVTSDKVPCTNIEQGCVFVGSGHSYLRHLMNCRKGRHWQDVDGELADLEKACKELQRFRLDGIGQLEIDNLEDDSLCQDEEEEEEEETVTSECSLFEENQRSKIPREVIQQYVNTSSDDSAELHCREEATRLEKCSISLHNLLFFEKHLQSAMDTLSLSKAGCSEILEDANEDVERFKKITETNYRSEMQIWQICTLLDNLSVEEKKLEKKLRGFKSWSDGSKEDLSEDYMSYDAVEMPLLTRSTKKGFNSIVVPRVTGKFQEHRKTPGLYHRSEPFPSKDGTVFFVLDVYLNGMGEYTSRYMAVILRIVYVDSENQLKVCRDGGATVTMKGPGGKDLQVAYLYLGPRDKFVKGFSVYNYTFHPIHSIETRAFAHFIEDCCYLDVNFI